MSINYREKSDGDRERENRKQRTRSHNKTENRTHRVDMTLTAGSTREGPDN